MTTGDWPPCRVNVGDRKPCEPRDDGRCQHCGDRLFDPAPLEAVRTGFRQLGGVPLEAVRAGFRQLGGELAEQVSREYTGDISGVEFHAPSGQTHAVMCWAQGAEPEAICIHCSSPDRHCPIHRPDAWKTTPGLQPDSPIPSESVRPLSSLADEPPDSCDLCSKAFGPDTPWRRMTIVVDSAPRSARDRSPLLMEDEWRLCVCTVCHEEFDTWLFRGASELDTLRPPPPVDTESETKG